MALFLIPVVIIVIIVVSIIRSFIFGLFIILLKIIIEFVDRIIGQVDKHVVHVPIPRLFIGLRSESGEALFVDEDS